MQQTCGGRGFRCWNRSPGSGAGAGTKVQRLGVQVLEQKYGLAREMIRAYVHYQPSYYHFHIHFVHTSLDVGGGAAVGKAHLLDDIIGVLSVHIPAHHLS